MTLRSCSKSEANIGNRGGAQTLTLGYHVPSPTEDGTCRAGGGWRKVISKVSFFQIQEILAFHSRSLAPPLPHPLPSTLFPGEPSDLRPHQDSIQQGLGWETGCRARAVEVPQGEYLAPTWALALSALFSAGSREQQELRTEAGSQWKR